MGHHRIGAVLEAGIVSAAIEHAHVQTQNIGKIDGPLHAGLVGADDQHVIAVDLQIRHVAEESLHELVDGLYVVEAAQGNGVHDAGIMGVEGDDVVHAHADQFLQGDGAVQRLAHGALVLTALIEIRHDDGDAPGLAADGGDHTLEVLIMVVGRHVVLHAAEPVGLAVIAHIHQQIEIHAADRLADHALAFTGSETRQITVYNVRGSLVADIGLAVLVFALALRPPVGQVIVDGSGHFLTAGDGDDAQCTGGDAFQLSLLMRSYGFHSNPLFP